MQEEEIMYSNGFNARIYSPKSEHPSGQTAAFPMITAEQETILVEGRNCWRKAKADRAAFLIDAQSYFSAFVSAVEQAEKSVFIIGWDLDSRTNLDRDNGGPEGKALLDFLNSAVSRRKGLHLYLLVWDFAMIYALEREPLPYFTVGLRTHDRIHFFLDANHPVGASHHQKIVVVDDKVAFVGGLDLTKCRWDTPDHLQNDPRRVDPYCGRYAPFHDVQMIFDGEAASAMGAIARERWHRATGEKVPVSPIIHNDVWPPGLTPELENVLIGIARTEPKYEGNSEVREVESLYKDAISAARRFIYIESQYFTSSVVCEVLMRRLQDEDGPEVVIVLPQHSSGWLEEKTMDVLRAGLLLRLKEADKFDRLRTFYPVLPNGNGSRYLNVHSKVLVVDNVLVRVGSSNLSNRSMGLDTECDVAIEANGDAHIADAIAAFRSRLVGEHLGAVPTRISEVTDRTGSLILAIESLRGSERTLEPFDGTIPEPSESWIYESGLLDPERPADAAEIIEQFIPSEIRHRGRCRIIGSIVVLIALLALAAVWQWTPLKQLLNIDTITYWAEYLKENSLALPVVLAAYIVGGLVVFPVTLLIAATAVAFDPFTALAYSFLGCLSSALLAFWIGQAVGRDAVANISSPRLYRLSQRLKRHGIVTVVMLRLFPIAPFTVINLFAGASQIKLRDYVIGSIIGLTPGLIAITILGERLESAIHEPKLENFLMLAGIVLVLAVVHIGIHGWLARRGSNADSASSLERAKNEPFRQNEP